MTDTPLTKDKFQTTLHLIGSNQTTLGRESMTFLLPRQIAHDIRLTENSVETKPPEKHEESETTGRHLVFHGSESAPLPLQTPRPLSANYTQHQQHSAKFLHRVTADLFSCRTSIAYDLAKWRPSKWSPVGGKHLKMVRPIRPLEGPHNFLSGCDF